MKPLKRIWTRVQALSFGASMAIVVAGCIVGVVARYFLGGN